MDENRIVPINRELKEFMQPEFDRLDRKLDRLLTMLERQRGGEKDAGRLRALEAKTDLIHAGIQIIHDDLLTARSEVRLATNRLAVVETTVREMEERVRSMDGKLDLILAHLGLEPPPG